MNFCTEDFGGGQESEGVRFPVVFVRLLSD